MARRKTAAFATPRTYRNLSLVVVAGAAFIAVVSEGQQTAAPVPVMARPFRSPAQGVTPQREARGFASADQTFAEQPDAATPIEPDLSTEPAATLPKAGSRLDEQSARPSQQQIAHLIAQSEVRSGAPGTD